MKIEEEIIDKYINSGDLDSIKNLINKGWNTRERKDYALVKAVKADQLELAKFFLDCGADVTTQFHEPIIAVFQTENPQMLELLLQYDFDLNFENGYCIRNAVYMGSEEFVDLLLDHGASWSGFKEDEGDIETIIIKNSSNELLQVFVDHGFPISEIISKGDTRQKEWLDVYLFNKKLETIVKDKSQNKQKKKI